MRDSRPDTEQIEAVVSLWMQNGYQWENVDSGRDAIKTWRESGVSGRPVELRVNIGSLNFSSTNFNNPVKDFVNECKRDASLTYDKIADGFKFSHEVSSPLMRQYSELNKKKD